MKKYTNYSGLCQNINEEESASNEKFVNDQPIIQNESVQINSNDTNITFHDHDTPIIDYNHNYLDEIMQKLECLRETDEEEFNNIIKLNQELSTVVSQYKNKESMKILEEIYSSVDFHGFLYWSAIKGLRKAILEIKQFELIHFFIVRQGMKLIDHSFKNILNEYFDSLSGVDFINCDDEEKILNYCNILHLLILNGEADINCYDDSGVGNSLLQTAILNKQYQFILFLLNNTVIDINYVNKEIKTALDICYEKIEETVYEEIFNLLIAFGAESVLHKKKIKKFLN